MLFSWSPYNTPKKLPSHRTLRLPCMWYICHIHHWSQIHTFYKSYQFSHLSPLNPSTFFCIDKFFHQFFPCNYTLFLMILLSARIFELTIELFLLKTIDTQFEHTFLTITLYFNPKILIVIQCVYKWILLYIHKILY